MQVLKGVYVVMVTPFTREGDVDYPGIGRNVEWWVSQGIHGLIPLGSTGEFASLSDSQKSRIIAKVSETVNGRIPVVIGATAETTEKAISNAREAEEAGAAGVLVLPPYYYTPSQEEIVVHYRRVAEALRIPLMIYNNPASSKVDIQPETVAKLSGIENIRYIKESSGDIKRITAIRTLTEDRMTVFCGWEDMAWESFLVGARGWVCVIGNVAPTAAIRLYDLVVEKKDPARGLDLYRKMLPLLRLLEYGGKTAKILKHGLDSMGLAGGFSSSPKLPLEEADRRIVGRLLAELRDGTAHF
jgi:4-hydroxy-tetrahydrodipicolinate synthase